MRIITGTARGTRLETLPGEDTTRPTPERVKEAVFSAIQFDLYEKRFLDLFAGSGQMGLEALSRGAARAVLIDENSNAVQIIKANAKKTHLFEKCFISNVSYRDYLRGVRDGNNSIVFISIRLFLKTYGQMSCRGLHGLIFVTQGRC